MLKESKRILRRLLRSGLSGLRKARRILGHDYGTNVIVCGPPRSGTSLAFLVICKQLPSFKMVLPRGNGRSREVSAVTYAYKPGNLIGKMPSDILRVTKIKAIAVKRNVFVCMIRDPRDILVSRHQWYNKNEYWVYPDMEAPKRRGAKEKYSPFGLLDYLASIREITGERGCQLLGKEACIRLVRYEDLVSGVVKINEVLCAAGLGRFLGTADRSPYDAGELASQGPKAASGANWKREEHRSKILRDFAEYPQLFEEVTFFGYERDQEWYRALGS